MIKIETPEHMRIHVQTLQMLLRDADAERNAAAYDFIREYLVGLVPDVIGRRFPVEAIGEVAPTESRVNSAACLDAVATALEPEPEPEPVKAPEPVKTQAQGSRLLLQQSTSLQW